MVWREGWVVIKMVERNKEIFRKMEGQLGQGAGLATDMAALDESVTPEPIKKIVTLTDSEVETQQLPKEQN